MNAQKFNCPHCQQKLEAPPELTGLSINCPACNKSLQVPKAPEPVRLSLGGAKIARAETDVPSIFPQAPAGQPVAQFLDLAPLGPRIGAKVADIFLLTGSMVALAYGSHYLVRALYQNGVSRETQMEIGTVILIITIVLPFLYHLFFLSSSGATLGKQMFGLKVIRQNRQPLGLVPALLRSLTEFICAGAGFGLALMIFAGLTRHSMFAPGPHRYEPFTMLFHLPVFLLVLAPYAPAFFTRNHQTVPDSVVQTVVVKS